MRPRPGWAARRALVATVALACVQAAAAASLPERPPVWALSRPLVDGPAWLVQIDPVSFARRPAPPVPLGPFRSALALSPDGLLLAAAHAERPVLGVFDLASRRQLFSLPLGTRADPEPWEVHWLSSTRVAVITAVGRGRSPELVLVDVPSGRVVRRQRLGGEIGAVRARAGRLVFPVGPAGRIASPRLYVLEEAGSLRRTSLGPVRMGSVAGPPAREVVPGLTTDGAGETAYVVSADGRVVTIELRSLLVRSAPIRTPAASLRAAKAAARTWVHARWLAPGLLATTSAGGNARPVPRGLRFLDPATGVSRLIDASAFEFWVAGDLVVAHGQERVRGYRLDGSPAWEARFDDLLGVVRVLGGFLHLLRADTSTAVLDAASGALLAEIGPPARELLPLGDRDAR